MSFDCVGAPGYSPRHTMSFDWHCRTGVPEQIHEDARTGPVVPPWSNVRRDLHALVRAYNPYTALWRWP